MSLLNSILKKNFTAGIKRIITYSVTPNANLVTEGTSVIFKVDTRNLPTSTILYYSLNNVSGGLIDLRDVVGDITGSIVVYNNLCLVNVRFDVDQITEGTETVVFNLRSGSTVGRVLATANVSILDTSTQSSLQVEYLVVGGGGAGGASGGGGGGGGAVAYGNFVAYTESNYTVVIGAGGAAPGGNGSSSQFATVLGLGGGGGGNLASIGKDGGSGGGSGTLGITGGISTASDEGNSGWGSSSSCWAGGGGGAGSQSTGKNGGSARVLAITGLSQSYGAGGGGGAFCDAELGGIGGAVTAGSGGGGRLQCFASVPTPGQANTGSGGGGAGSTECGWSAGNGGSGVVIIKIPRTRTAIFSSGVTAVLSTLVPNFNIYTITGTASTTETVRFI